MTASKRTPLKLVSFDDIQVDPSARNLVKGLIPQEGITLVYGAPKTGKSFWVFDLSMHVALGWKYRGRKVLQGPVVYCALEGQHGLAARVEAFRRHFLVGHLSPVPFYLQPVTLDLIADHIELVELVRGSLGQTKPAALVIDTLNRSLAGSESNDADMGAYIRAADVLRSAFNCAVIIVHHSGVDAGRPRGHTSLTASVDAQFKVTRSSRRQIIRVELERCKDGKEGAVLNSILSEVELGVDDDGDPVTSCVVIPRDDDDDAGLPREGLRPLPATVGAALGVLRDLVQHEGTTPQASLGAPSGARVVSVAAWRRRTYELPGTPKQDRARQQRFKRSLTALADRGVIEVKDELVWLAA